MRQLRRSEGHPPIHLSQRRPLHVCVVKYFVFISVPVATVNLRVRPRESPPKLAEVSRWRPFGRASASALLSRRFMKLQYFRFTFSFGKRLRLPEPIDSVADELSQASSFVLLIPRPKKISGSTSTETFPGSRFPNLRRRNIDRKQKVNDGG